MEYTIQKLANIAGISSRTLRYYDKLNLLKPARINSSGYRIYSQTEVDLLQLILFYRELDMSLESIRKIITQPGYEAEQALRDHRTKMLEKRSRLDLLISNLDKTIAEKEGGIKMTDSEKFKGLKQNLIDENEIKYGQEIRQKYGDEAINRSNEKLLGMSREEYDKVTRLAAQIKTTLAEAFKTGDPTGTLAQETADLHRQWLCFSWPQYNKDAHAGLAQMYVDDERFRAYYDDDQPGTAAFFRDAILIYTDHRDS